MNRYKIEFPYNNMRYRRDLRQCLWSAHRLLPPRISVPTGDQTRRYDDNLKNLNQMVFPAVILCINKIMQNRDTHCIKKLTIFLSKASKPE